MPKRTKRRRGKKRIYCFKRVQKKCPGHGPAQHSCARRALRKKKRVVIKRVPKATRIAPIIKRRKKKKLKGRRKRMARKK
jgi:hypothetical protein